METEEDPKQTKNEPSTFWSDFLTGNLFFGVTLPIILPTIIVLSLLIGLLSYATGGVDVTIGMGLMKGLEIALQFLLLTIPCIMLAVFIQGWIKKIVPAESKRWGLIAFIKRLCANLFVLGIISQLSLRVVEAFLDDPAGLSFICLIVGTAGLFFLPDKPEEEPVAKPAKPTEDSPTPAA